MLSLGEKFDDEWLQLKFCRIIFVYIYETKNTEFEFLKRENFVDNDEWKTYSEPRNVVFE